MAIENLWKAGFLRKLLAKVPMASKLKSQFISESHLFAKRILYPMCQTKAVHNYRTLSVFFFSFKIFICDLKCMNN